MLLYFLIIFCLKSKVFYSCLYHCQNQLLNNIESCESHYLTINLDKSISLENIKENEKTNFLMKNCLDIKNLEKALKFCKIL